MNTSHVLPFESTMMNEEEFTKSLQRVATIILTSRAFLCYAFQVCGTRQESQSLVKYAQSMKKVAFGRSTVKTVDGVAQVIAQSQSRVHQAAASYRSGFKEEWEDGPNAIVSSANESKYQQPGQKTITEALKIVTTNSSSPECIHVFEYPDIVASFRVNCTIRKFSTKELFD